MESSERQAICVESLAHGGDGIARVDGRACFVPYGLPGDAGDAALVPGPKGTHRAVDAEWSARSPDYAAPPCDRFGRCGGCNWLHFAYPAQAEWKCRIVQDCFARIGGLDVTPEFAGDPALRLGYRTRARFQADGTHTGFFSMQSHEVVDISACPLCHPKLNDALARLRSIRYPHEVAIVVDPEGDACLVWTERDPAPLRSIFDTVNTPGDGRPRGNFLFDGVPIVNGCFAQSSLLLNRVLRGVVRECAGSPESLLDLYCGTGNFSLGIDSARTVVGVDAAGPAVMAAHRLGRGEYRIGDESAMAAAIGERAWDAVILDPPRAGARAVAKALARARTPRIVYVSCDPATLARDAKILTAAGWRIDRLTVVDMFPHTAHIESVTRFVRG